MKDRGGISQPPAPKRIVWDLVHGDFQRGRYDRPSPSGRCRTSFKRFASARQPRFFTLRAQAPFAKKEDVRRMLNPSSITHLLPRGFGSSHRSRIRHGQPSMVSCRSRMLVMELVRLQRALKAAMPCSTHSNRVFERKTFAVSLRESFRKVCTEPCVIFSFGNTGTFTVGKRIAFAFPDEFGRHGNGSHGDMVNPVQWEIR